MLIEKCAYKKAATPIRTTHLLRGLPVSDRNGIAIEILWLLSKDTVSGIELETEDSKNAVSLERADGRTSQNNYSCCQLETKY